MSFVKSIHKKLESEFSPQSLEIVNESHLHAGHQENFDGSGETHLRIKIVSDAFEGMNRVARHRAINAQVEAEIALGLHAVAIEVKAPSEIK